MEDFDGILNIKHLSSNAIFEFYSGTDAVSCHEVLIKTTVRNFHERHENWPRILIKEHEIAKQFSRRNIIAKSIIKEGEHSEYLIYNTEYFKHLSDFTHQKNTDYAFIYKIAIQIAHHLEIMHAKNQGHFNLSPENILIDKETYKVKLLNICAFPKYELICNLQYIAPEQTGRLTLKIDLRADFYSLGVILYQLITGKHPISDIDSKSIYRRQITDRFPAADTVDVTIPTALSDIIHKLTAKQPVDRYQNATSLKYDLMQGLKLLKTSPQESFMIGSLDYISAIQFPKPNQFFEKEKDDIITTIKHIDANKITIINLSGTLSQGKNDFANDIIASLDEQKICNIQVSALEATKSIPYCTASNVLKEIAYYLYNNSLFEKTEIHDFFTNLPTQLALSIIKLCPSIGILFNINIEQKNDYISDVSVLFTAFRQFLNFICSKTRPLVIYVENVENIDSSSFKLFIHLMNEHKLNDVVIVHSTIKTVHLSKSINKDSVIFRQFEIPRLSKRKIYNLIFKTFKTDEQTSNQLVELLIEKTKGKIKQVYTLLHIFIDKGYILFDKENFVWIFDFEKIAAYRNPISYETVIDFNFNQINAKLRKLLIESASIGYIFDLRILQKTHGYNIRSLSVSFRDLLEYDLIEPLERYAFLNNNNNPIFYKFKNTKIQRYLESKISPDDKIHFGSLYSAIINTSLHDETYLSFYEEFIKEKQTMLSELSWEDMFEILQFYYTKASTFFYLRKFVDAEKHVNYCISLLKKEGWTLAQYYTARNIYLLGMKISAHTFYFSQSESYYQSAIKHISVMSDKIPFIELQIDSLIIQGKQKDAIRYINELFEIIKLSTSKKDSFLSKTAKFITLQLFYNKLFKNKITYNNNRNSLRRKTLSYTNTRLAKIDEQLYEFTLYKIIQDTIVNGIDHHYIFPLLFHSRRLILNPKTFAKGIKLSSLIIDLISSKDKEFEDELHFYYRHILPYTNHIQELNHNDILRHYLSNGENTKALEIAQVLFCLNFFKGINLKLLSLEIKKMIEEIGKVSKKSELLSIVSILDTRIKSLTQIRKKVDPLHNAEIQKHDFNSNNLTVSWDNITLLVYFFLNGEFEKAQISANNVLSNAELTEDKLPYCIAQFYDSLISCETYAKMTSNEQQTATETLQNRILFFKELSKFNPDNFNHNYLILEAEMYRMKGNNEKAIFFYNKSIECCDTANLHHMSGYTHKRLASLYQTMKMNDKAMNHVIKSYNYYKFWGTETIANKIKFEHFSMFDDLEIRIYNIS